MQSKSSAKKSESSQRYVNAPMLDLLAQVLHLVAGADVCAPDFLGEGGDEVVAAGGELGSGTAQAGAGGCADIPSPPANGNR
jgi:hypothetical protein